MQNKLVIVFGATGAIGSAICNWFETNGYNVISVSRSPLTVPSNPNFRHLIWDGDECMDVFSELSKESVQAAVWAQGMNFSDNINDFNYTDHQAMYNANVTYILLSLQALIRMNLIAPSARLCIISSIWQNIAKPNKLSYCITKSALQGLVQSLAVDLGRNGYMINAVLPGALDTPMTRANLSESQLHALENMTPLGTLPTLADVCNLAGFLCSHANTGITGQFITADRGFTHARII
ncbi:MAG: SDR family NAD(P)-dependent oxidoreductase [Methylococcales bacterium]|nr:SDR family NAD(P)-dependent oxidoreductase [Methylococcales bacterium]